jgi:hypothetical protein
MLKNARPSEYFLGAILRAYDKESAKGGEESKPNCSVSLGQERGEAMPKVLPHECILCESHSCEHYEYIKDRRVPRFYPLHHCKKVNRHFHFVVPDWCPRQTKEVTQ